MINRVISGKGTIIAKIDLFNSLVNLNPNHPFKKQKALGSIGGAVNSGYIVDLGNCYMCTR